MFHITHKPKSKFHRLRILFKEEVKDHLNPSQPFIDLVYNSKHGLLINGQMKHVNLRNVSYLYIVIDSNNTLYLSANNLSFVHIFHS